MVTDSAIDIPPPISIVVPLYNKERHVGRALASLDAQSFREFEVVVVDDGSTDGGADVVLSRDDPRTRLLAQANGGVSAARNRGIAASRAPLIAFLDADDEWRPDFLSNILELQRRYPEAAAFALNYEIVAPDGKRTRGVGSVVDESVLLDPAAFFKIGKFGSPVFSSSVAVRTPAFDRAGLFPVGVKLGEDLDTWLRICFVAPIAFGNRIGGIYRQDADQRAVVRHRPPERYAFFETIDRWVAANPALPRAVHDDIREFRNSFVLAYARDQIRFGDPARGRRALLACRTRTFVAEKCKWLIASLLSQRLQGVIAGVRASGSARRSSGAVRGETRSPR